MNREGAVSKREKVDLAIMEDFHTLSPSFSFIIPKKCACRHSLESRVAILAPRGIQFSSCWHIARVASSATCAMTTKNPVHSRREKHHLQGRGTFCLNQASQPCITHDVTMLTRIVSHQQEHPRVTRKEHLQGREGFCPKIPKSACCTCVATLATRDASFPFSCSLL